MPNVKSNILDFRAYFLLAVLLLLAGVFASGCSSDPSITPSISDVQVRVSEEGKLVLSGKTSLPDGTKIMSLLLQTVPVKKGLYVDAPFLYPAEWDVVVVNGAFQSWFPSAYKKGLAAGRYVVQIGVPPNQDALLGPKNAWLSGPGVVEEKNGLKTFAPEFDVSLPDLSPHLDE